MRRERIIIFLGAFIVFLVLCEVILRVRGVTPFVPRLHRVIYEPSFIFSPHSNLGYTLKSGEFRFTLLALDSLTFHPMHNPDFTRATSSKYPGASTDERSSIGIFGASFTYGVGVEDSITYPWLLQNGLDDYEVINYGVPGYGPIHALLLLKDLIIKGEMPSVVILAYSYYHDNTNTLPRRSRETIARFSNLDNNEFIEKSKVPYCQMEEDGGLIIKHLKYDSFYTEWPFRRQSALVNMMEMKYNEVEEETHNGHEISKTLILKIADLCRKNGSELLIVGITGHDLTRELLTFCSENDIKNADISVDLDEGSKYRIHPDDSHPNGKAHMLYAERILKILRD